jgi:hypothetical protein
MHPIVEKLVALIETHRWKNDFTLAIRNAQAHDVPGIREIRGLGDYLRYIDDLVAWTPREHGDSRYIYDRLAKFYFFMDQPPVKALQSPIRPGRRAKKLTPLS